MAKSLCLNVNASSRPETTLPRDDQQRASSKANRSSKAAWLTPSSSRLGTYSGTTLASSRSVSRSSRMLLALFVTSSRYSACRMRTMHEVQPPVSPALLELTVQLTMEHTYRSLPRTALCVLDFAKEKPCVPSHLLQQLDLGVDVVQAPLEGGICPSTCQRSVGTSC